MDGRLFAQAYSFDQQFKPYGKQRFVNDFFTDPNVLATLKMVSASTQGGSWSVLGTGTKVNRVEIEDVLCSTVSMTMFDSLNKSGIIRETGDIKKCFDEYVGDFIISDELRQVLLNEDFEHYGIFTADDRREFIFRIFKHLCLGGGICQYEDTVAPYLEAAKLVYKDLVSVQKDPNTKELVVTSQVYQVTAFDGATRVYPSDKEHENTYAYLIVDALKRHVHVFYHCFGGGVFG